ncbi:hypothetical protein [Alkaliphilus serpentinus]|nr:hypothetical protein [Alkaliphilus serpentinus]
MRFNSKKDLWLGLLIWIPISGGFIVSLMSEGWLIKILMLATAIFAG